MEKPDKFPRFTFPVLVESELTGKWEKHTFTCYYPAYPIAYYRSDTLYYDTTNYNVTRVTLDDGTELICAWSYKTFDKNAAPFINYYYKGTSLGLPTEDFNNNETGTN